MSREQYWFLVHLRRSGKINSSDVSIDRSDLSYLAKRGYVKHISNTFTGGSDNYYQLTGAGRAAMHTYWLENYRWWIPVILSFIAIAISITSLITQLL